MHCTGKKYQKNNETRQTEIQAYYKILDNYWTFSCVSYNIAHCGRLNNVRMIAWIFATECLSRNRRERCYVATSLDFLSFIYCVRCSAAGIFKKKQTLRSTYERHTCLMCTRSKAALSLPNDTYTLDILSKKNYISCFIDWFPLFFLHKFYYNVPCNLNAFLLTMLCCYSILNVFLPMF